MVKTAAVITNELLHREIRISFDTEVFCGILTLEGQIILGCWGFDASCPAVISKFEGSILR